MRDFSSSTESFSDCAWPEADVQLAADRIVLRGELLLQRGHGRGHLVGVIGRLLGQMLNDAQARVQCRLDALHPVQQLLHLRLQLDDLLRRGARGRGRRKERSQQVQPRKEDDDEVFGLSA